MMDTQDELDAAMLLAQLRSWRKRQMATPLAMWEEQYFNNLERFLSTLNRSAPIAEPGWNEAVEACADVAKRTRIDCEADGVGIKPTNAGAIGVLCVSIGGAAAAKSIEEGIRALAKPQTETGNDANG